MLTVDGVTKSFPSPNGTAPVLRDVTFSAAPGEIVAVAGRSGSGKTTLLTILAGWETADAGVVRLLGEPPTGREPWSVVGIVPQALGLMEELTIAENVGLPGRLAPGDLDPGAVDGLMAELGLGHLARRFPHQVSLGEQQRAALARAILLRPRLLLADEPVSHQNREWASAMVGLLRSSMGPDSVALLATHDPLVIEAADRVLVLDGGG